MTRDKQRIACTMLLHHNIILLFVKMWIDWVRSDPICHFNIIADVSTGVSCKLNNDGFVGKIRKRKLEMDTIWVPIERRTEAKAEPSTSE